MVPSISKYLSFLQLYRAYAAFPDFFRNTTAQWWETEIREYHTNPTQPEKSVKFDGLWIVSIYILSSELKPVLNFGGFSEARVYTKIWL